MKSVRIAYVPSARTPVSKSKARHCADMPASNGSSASLLHWYKDRTGGRLPRAWVFSLPLGVYRLAMLAWALWLAHALLGWLKWGWECFSTGGLWKRAPKPVPPPPPAP